MGEWAVCDDKSEQINRKQAKTSHVIDTKRRMEHKYCCRRGAAAAWPGSSEIFLLPSCSDDNNYLQIRHNQYSLGFCPSPSWKTFCLRSSPSFCLDAWQKHFFYFFRWCQQKVEDHRKKNISRRRWRNWPRYRVVRGSSRFLCICHYFLLFRLSPCHLKDESICSFT